MPIQLPLTAALRPLKSLVLKMYFGEYFSPDSVIVIH
jgi:hypothetical protein